MTNDQSALSKIGKEAYRVLLVSRHDYRTAWRANFHPLADSFHRLGSDVSFVSVGFSWLSLLIRDRRAPLSTKSNRWDNVNGIDCYLWQSKLHPFRLPPSPFNIINSMFFRLWTKTLPRAVRQRAASADLILVESDLSSTLVKELRATNPAAKIAYIASDLLETIGAAPEISQQLYANRFAIDFIVVVSRGMTRHLAKLDRPIVFLPHGLNPKDFDNQGPSPYKTNKILISVGSMLFDEEIVLVAAEAFPDFEIHLIGAPVMNNPPANVIQHGQMAFTDTVGWLRHAMVGFAPYKISAASEYLADSSMKLAQFGYLGLPAVCPNFAVGDYAGRYGYDVGHKASIVAAFQSAIVASETFLPNLEAKTWEDIASQIVTASIGGQAIASEVGS